MTNQLKQFLLTQGEYDTCNFISEVNGTYNFKCTIEYIDETHLVTLVPFTNDDNEEGFTIERRFNNHMTDGDIVFVSELN